MKDIATLEVSAGRRVTGVFVHVALGLLLIYVAAAHPPDHPVGLAALLVFGLIALWQGTKLWTSTARSLILRSDGLYDSTGEQLTPLDNIKAVDRSFFAFKPSNGFLIKLKDPVGRAWVPGLWWRYGKRIGVGGSTSGRASREMADVIAVMLTERGKDLIGD